MVLMKITGGCHCGQITYEAQADPDNTLICHCTDCQVISGAPYRTVVFASEENFTLTSDTLKTYIKTADSGNSLNGSPSSAVWRMRLKSLNRTRNKQPRP